jgi:hypothetical protein
MERITAADIATMRANGYDRSTIAEAEAWFLVCQRADELIMQIRAAFAGVELEDGIGLREACGIDDYAGKDELARLRAIDEKHDWQSIPSLLLNQCKAAPSFLDAEGMRFHTPAFLASELNGDCHIDFIGRLIYGSYHATDFPQLLNDDQRAAIIACIRFYAEHFSYDQDRLSSALARFSKVSGR